MNAFKVTFDHDKPVSADQILVNHCDSVKYEDADGHLAIKWLTIYAETEEESIRIAQKVAKGYLYAA